MIDDPIRSREDADSQQVRDKTRWSSDVWIEAWCDLVRKWRRALSAEEQGQIISGVGPFLQRRAIERQGYTCREQFVSRSDKAVRAQSMRGRMAMLGLYVRQAAPWFADLRAELLSFPAGKYDDQVDALGLVGQLLDRISARRKPKPPEFALHDAYRWAYEEMPDVNGVESLIGRWLCTAKRRDGR